MKKILVYSADANLMNSSKVLIGVCDTKEKAIELLTPKLEMVSIEEFADHSYSNHKDMLSDLVFSLNNYNQTQILSDNYMIEEIELNELSIY